MPVIFDCGDLKCKENYTENKRRCECQPFEWMECNRELYPDSHCDQEDFDHMNDRDPQMNPYQKEWWYRKSKGWRLDEDRYKIIEPKYFDARDNFGVSLQEGSFSALSALAMVFAATSLV